MKENKVKVAASYVSKGAVAKLWALHGPISDHVGGTLQFRGVLEWMISDAYKRGAEFWEAFEVVRDPGYKKVYIGTEYHDLLRALTVELAEDCQHLDSPVAMVNVADYIIRRYYQEQVVEHKKSHAGQAEDLPA